MNTDISGLDKNYVPIDHLGDLETEKYEVHHETEKVPSEILS